MTMMMITGIITLIAGVLITITGMWLNINTPMQQRLPLIGIPIGVIGLFIMILA